MHRAGRCIRAWKCINMRQRGRCCVLVALGLEVQGMVRLPVSQGVLAGQWLVWQGAESAGTNSRWVGRMAMQQQPFMSLPWMPGAVCNVSIKACRQAAGLQVNVWAAVWHDTACALCVGGHHAPECGGGCVLGAAVLQAAGMALQASMRLHHSCSDSTHCLCLLSCYAGCHDLPAEPACRGGGFEGSMCRQTCWLGD